jgi:choline dehydrogenase-like flavoprotein
MLVSVTTFHVIVAGGTAGLALAARLTENPSINVLVSEAGENRLNVSLLSPFSSAIYSASVVLKTKGMHSLIVNQTTKEAQMA